MTSSTPPARRPDFPRVGDPQDRRSGENFTSAQLGKLAELGRYGVRHPLVKDTIHGKVFLHEVLGLTGMEISFGVIPPLTSLPFHHKHQENEEVYLFLSGQGDYKVDDQSFPIAEGSVVRVAPSGVRIHRNTSTEPMVYICIQAKAGSLTQWTGTDGIGVDRPVVWDAAS